MAFSQVLPFQSYSVTDGLLSNGVHTFFQDSQGYLWIGTRDGLSVFDGWIFTNYTTNDGLPPGLVRQILEDRVAPQKTLWILTSGGGLCRFVDGKLIPFSDSSAAWVHQVISLGQDHSGTIWVGTEDTLAQIVQGRFQPVRTGIRMGLVDFIQEQGDSLVWFASRSGLTCYSFRTGRFKEVDIGLPLPLFTAALFPDGEGNLWLGTGSSIVQIRDCKVMSTLRVSGLGFLVKDNQGNLWFGSYAGLYRVRGHNLISSQVDHFTTVNGLPENTLKTAFVDRENNLWIGGIARGIARLSETTTFRFPLKDINPAYQYSIGASDSNSHIWIATPSGLWEIWEDFNGRWHQALANVNDGRGEGPGYPVFDVSVKDNLPYSIFIDPRGRLWIGYSNAQLACYEVTSRGDAPSRLKLVRTLRPRIDFPDGFPMCFIVDRRDMVWYSEGNRVLLLDPSRSHPLVRIFGDREGISSERTYVRVLAADKRGSIWTGFFNSGVARLDVDSISVGSFHPFPLPEESFDQRIASIREDKVGKVWIASESNGLIILEDGTLAVRSIRDGLPSNIVTSVTEDNAGKVWVGTGVGVAYLDSAGSGVAHRKRNLADSYVFCSGTTKRGLVWFVTQSGLVVYNPLDDERHDSIPPPLITNLRVNEVDRAHSGGLNLSYDENNVEIGFVALTFRDQKDVQYQYRMSGIDPNWRPSSTIRAVTYAALSPGDYTFEVRAFDARGVRSANTTLLNFSIVPPFWRTWWFTLLFWVIVAIAVGSTIRFVEIRKTRRRLQALEHQQVRDKERLRISHDMHDEVGASLTEIAILGELAQRNVEQSLEAKEHMKKIAEKSRAVIDNIGEIIWAINPQNDPLENLVAYLHRYSVDYLKSSSVNCRFEMPDLLPPVHLTSESRRNVFLVVKEALHNVVKHSGATYVHVALTIDDQAMVIIIEDNGTGLSSNEGAKRGMGLYSMKKRAEDIGGSLAFESNQPSGTRVHLRIPMASAGGK